MNVCARERERERKRRECIREIRKIHAHLIAFVLPHRFDFFLRIQSHVSFFPAYIELRVTYIISRSKKKTYVFSIRLMAKEIHPSFEKKSEFKVFVR